MKERYFLLPVIDVITNTCNKQQVFEALNNL